MTPTQQTGRLINWHSDRGFGFIKPDFGDEEVLLHISVLKKTDRSPQVGDRIVFEAMPLPGQKLRAVKASIGGITLQLIPTQTKTAKLRRLKPIGATAIIGTIAFFQMQGSPNHSQSVTASVAQPEYLIKGDISYTIDQKIYDLPAMDDYASTAINLTAGEQWFYTESEAIQQGWGNSPR
ncbi:MAG: cold shock domain-containing protein [Microcoleaceae cyanobacterium]